MYTLTFLSALSGVVLICSALPQDLTLSRTHRDNDALDIDPYGVAGKLAAMATDPPVTEEATTTEEPIEEPPEVPEEESSEPEEPPLKDDVTPPLEPQVSSESEVETEATTLQTEKPEVHNTTEKGFIDRIDECRRRNKESLLDIVSDQIDYIKHIDPKRRRRSAEAEKNSLLLCSVRELLKEGKVLEALSIRVRRSAQAPEEPQGDFDSVNPHVRSISDSLKTTDNLPHYDSFYDLKQIF